MSCLWVSELCDSEANSSMAGQDSTCDFDIRAGLNRLLPKDLWPVWSKGKCKKKNSEVNREDALPLKIEIDPGIPGFPMFPSAPRYPESDRLEATGWSKGDFLAGSASDLVSNFRICFISEPTQNFFLYLELDTKRLFSHFQKGNKPQSCLNTTMSLMHARTSLNGSWNFIK